MGPGFEDVKDLEKSFTSSKPGPNLIEEFIPKGDLHNSVTF